MSPYIPVNWSEHESGSSDDDARAGSVRPVYDDDKPCPSCGYNLRGLRLGSRCPECGWGSADASENDSLNIRAGRLHRLVDAMVVAGPAERRRWSLGLAMAALCITAVIAARLWFFAMGVSANALPVREYLIFGAVVSAIWAAAVWMILPSSINTHWPRLRLLRMGIIATQCLWLPAYGLWMLRNFGSGANAELLLVGHLTLRVIAGAGFIALGQLLVFICEEAELEHAARRFNTASWLIAFPSLLGQLFVGLLPWIVIVLYFFVLAWWVWMLAYYVLGFTAMRQHIVWAQRHRVEAAGRAHRVAAKKAELEEAAARQVRPTPVDQVGDEPLAT